MNFPQGLLATKVSRTLLLVCLLQLSNLLFFRYHASDQARIQRVTTDSHSSAAVTLSSDVTIEDFGLMGKRIAALADLAEHYVDNPSLDSSSLTDLVAEHFPWWNESTLPYFPWKYKPWHERPFSDLKLFGSNTGIVIPTGDGNARETAHLIAHLRNVHKSKLPIDIAHVGDDDLSPRYRKFLSKIGENIHFIDLARVFNDSLVHLGSYATKPFALLASRYSETILMDSDAIFFSPPEELFRDYTSLQETGALFFHDRSVASGGTGRTEWVAAQLEAAGQPSSAHLNYSSLFYRQYIEEEADAAVVCIDKSRPKIYMAMVFACWMNVQEVRDAVTWAIWWFEKESYWLAPELMGLPYSFEPWSSARLAQSAAKEIKMVSDIKMLPNDDEESAKPRPARMRRVVGEKAPFERHTGSEPRALAANRRCTTHMVHARASGNEPLWANGGLWLDKTDKGLGLANWTHWYLGDRIDKAISDLDLDSTDPRDDWAPEDGDEEAKQLIRQGRKEQVMATQPKWLNDDWGKDAIECPPHDGSGWKRLSPDFRTRLQRIIEEVRIVDAAFRRDLG